MVAITKAFQPIPRSAMQAPRDLSLDHALPPLKGEACFVVMLISINKKAKWRPRRVDAIPPIVAITGAGLFTFTRSELAAFKDVTGFNRTQLRSRQRVGLWRISSSEKTTWPREALSLRRSRLLAASA